MIYIKKLLLADFSLIYRQFFSLCVVVRDHNNVQAEIMENDHGKWDKLVVPHF